MIKLVYVVRRRADVSQKQFYKYWLEQHGPLFRNFAKTVRARKYVQSHTLNSDMGIELTRSREMGEPFDGITEVWWDSLSDLAAGFGSSEGQEINRALVEDEHRFVDVRRSFILLTEEHPIFDFTDDRTAGAGRS